MNQKGEISTLKAWLMVLASLIDDAVVLALILLGMWYFHVKITWGIILVLAVAMVAFVFIMHKAVVPALRRRKLSGSEGMIGAIGRVTESLKPGGTVKINDEYWKARSVEGEIEAGGSVEVTGINGLNLEVRKKSQ
jgi:membrane protein implicated in regulation of membrane protease activity